MENTGKLIILLTSSEHDRGELRFKSNWPNRNVVYLECDTGRICSDMPLGETTRLLSVVLKDDKDIPGNTGDVAAALTACKGFDPVIGTHTGQNAPATVLDLSLLPVSAIAYTTASETYHFVNSWCRELAKEKPDPQLVCESFDKLFVLLQSRRNAAQPGEWSNAKHHLLNLLAPVRIDFAGWSSAGFDEEYFNTGPPEPFPIEQINDILYKHAETGTLQTLEQVIENCLGRKLAPHIRGELEASWKKLQELLPRSGKTEPGSLFGAATEAIDRLQTIAGRTELKSRPKAVEQVLEWIAAIKAALDSLSDIIGGQCQ